MEGSHIIWYHELHRHTFSSAARLWKAGFIVDIHN